MKKLATFLAVAILLMTTSAMAVPISGTIGFFGSLALTGLTDPVVAATATGVNFNSGFVYGGKSGDFATVNDFTPVSFSNFTFNPSLSPSPVTDLWTFKSGDITYSFDLLSITASNVPSNTLALNGYGLLHITGFEDTYCNWVLTTQDGKVGDLIFSASAAPVPEPGTMVLLGFGLVGLAIYGKRRMNKEP